MGLEGIILVIKNAVSAVLDWIPKIKALCKNKDIPSKTIVIVNTDPGFQNFWHIGSTGGEDPKPLLQISCDFMVTNITDRPVGLAQAIWKGSIKGGIFTRQILVRDLNSRLSGNYDIPPHARTDVGVHFMISTKKMPKVGEAIKLDIGIIDQYGNTHWIKKVLFRSTP